MDMTLDVTQVLVGYDGEPLMDARQKLDEAGNPVLDAEGRPVIERIPITLRPVCINALKAPIESDKGMDGTKKTAIWVLCGKLFKEDKPFMLAAELTMLQQRVGTVYPPEIVGPALLLLNGTPATQPAPKLAGPAK